MHHPAMPRQKDTGPRLHSSSHFHRLLTVTKAPARVPVGLQAEPGCPRPGTIFPGDDGVVAAASAPASRRAALEPESPRAGRGAQGQQRAATTSLSAGGLSQPSLCLTGRGTGPKGSPSSSFSHAVPPTCPRHPESPGTIRTPMSLCPWSEVSAHKTVSDAPEPFSRGDNTFKPAAGASQLPTPHFAKGGALSLHVTPEEEEAQRQSPARAASRGSIPNAAASPAPGEPAWPGLGCGTTSPPPG